MEFIGIGIALGLTGLGSAIGEGLIGRAAMEAFSRQPEMEGKIRTLMLVAMAFTETAVLFGLVISILLYAKL